MMRRLWGWLCERLGLAPIIAFVRNHKVPAGLKSRAGWMYVFGLATLLVFVMQVVTGLALTTVYIPSPESAYQSLVLVTYESTWGAMVRGLHYYGASAMVVLICFHMGRVYLTAAYKYPREVSWMTGVVLFGLTMAMAVTGQLLRWDQNGMWTVVVAAKFVARVPLIGPWLGEFVLAGPSLTGATLSRFYSLHTMGLPLTIGAFIAVHMYLLVHHGISEPPKAGQPVDPATYVARYKREKEDNGIRYWPDAAWREILVAFIAIGGVFALALTLGPKGPAAVPDPTDLGADPRPDWFVRWYYALLWLKPAGLETLVMVYLPLIVFFGLILLPLVANKGERSLQRRPWALAIVAVIVVALGTLTGIGVTPPWVPAYDTKPFEASELPGATPVVQAGARLFYERGCQYCHQVLDRGGSYGPNLTMVTERMSLQEVRVWVVKGGGNMPAFRGAITPKELDALMLFLQVLPARQRGQEPSHAL